MLNISKGFPQKMKTGLGKEKAENSFVIATSIIEALVCKTMWKSIRRKKFAAQP